MAYTFTITEVTPEIGLTVNPAAVFTTTQSLVTLNISETQPQWNITTPANNEFTVNDDGFIFTLTNIDTVVELTQNPATEVTLNNSVSTVNLVTSATNVSVLDAPQVVYTATTQISQIQTENMATIFKGEFTSTDATIYYRGHIVRYNQNIYVATVEPGERITNPAAPPGNPQWTLVFSQTGLTGWQVESMEKAYNIGPWTAGATYVLNSWVSHNGYIWQLDDLEGTYGSEPSLSNPYWSQVGSQGDQPLFTTSSVTFKDLTLNGDLNASGNGSFSNLTVSNRLTAGGMRYPITHGLYGQVLTTNGVNEANWTDVSAIGTGTIRPATTENLGGIIVGTGLNITPGGTLSVSTGSGGINIGWNLTDDLRTNGYSIETGVPPVISQATPVPKLEIGSGLANNMDAALIFDARSSSTSQIRLIGDNVIIGSGNPNVTNLNNGVRFTSTGTTFFGVTKFDSDYVYFADNTTTTVVIGNTTSTKSILIGNKIQGLRGSGFGYYTHFGGNLKIDGYLLGGSDTTPVKVNKIQFLDGTIQDTALQNVPIASTSTAGIIKVGHGLAINPLNGILVATYELPTASETTLGGIKVGAGLAIDAEGVLAVTTTSEFIIPPADENTIGGAKISTSSNSTLAQTAGVYMDGDILKGRIADGSLGMVTIDSTYGIAANGSGLLTLVRATTTQLGGVKIDGTTIVIDGNGVISAPNGGGSTSTGKTYYAGSGIAINTLSNVISVTTASTSTIGGIVIGDGLQVNNGKTTLKLGGNSLYIDSNGALNVVSTASSGVFDLSADGYTNGYSIRHSLANSSTFITVGANNIGIASPLGVLNVGNQTYMTAGGLAGRLDLGSYTTLRATQDSGLFITPSGANLQFNPWTKLQLAIDDVQLQANSDAYRLALGPYGAEIRRADDPNQAKIVLDLNETILSNNVIVKVESPDTRFGKSLYDSRIYAAVILNYSGTGPPLLAEGTQYGDLSVQRTAYPAYNYGQVIRGAEYGPTVPQDFNNLSLAVDFNR